MRIILVITAMGCGGAEGVLAELANHLAGRGHQISLLVLHPGPVFHQIADSIDLCMPTSPERLRGRGLPASLLRFVHRLTWLRRMIRERQAEVILSFIEVANTITLAATLGSDLPVVVSERTYPPRYRVGVPYSWLRRLLYPRAQALVVQTDLARQWACGWLKRPVHVVPNPVIARQRGDTPVEPEVVLPPGDILVSAGRLVQVKRYDLLVEAFRQLSDQHREWSLVILGEGELRGELERQVERAGLSGRVMLPGLLRHPAAVFEHCHLYALTSEFEGFPNALCEAMACGVPAVSFDCAAGPGDIIRHGIDGLLVPAADLRALTAALDRLMSDPQERSRLAARAVEVCDRFQAEKIFDRWEKLLCQFAAER